MTRLIIIAGIILILIGIAVSYAPWLLNWFGRLPGDVRIEAGRNSIIIPVVSMVLISIILTLLINLFFRR